MTFHDLGLDKPLLAALEGLGHTTPTPIQTSAIPAILDGNDVVGLAQTGTGKTGAFTLPLLQRLARSAPQGKRAGVRLLVLSPTRELAAQIHKAVRDYGRKLPSTSACVVGGVSINGQKKALAAHPDILVATPGRLLDLVDQKAVRFNHVEALVLDEADQMLDIGFMPAIRRIVALLPARRQTLLFSATMPKEIEDLSAKYLKDPVRVAVAPVAATADRIDQSVMHVDTGAKLAATARLVRDNAGKRVIVFTRTKRGADRVVKQLAGSGLEAAAIHGNKSQSQRERALGGFRNGSCPVLVATDIAARGIDVPGVELVINYDLPNVPEVYVHRIGRTARAGASGSAVSLVAGDDRSLLRDIERLIRRQIPVDGPAPAPLETARPQAAKSKAAKSMAAAQPAPKRRRNRRRPPRRDGQAAGARAAA